jgi:magnesium transporter
MVLSNRYPEAKQLNLKTITFGDLTWVDIVQPTKEAGKYLVEHYNFNPLDIEDALSSQQVSKIEEYPEYLFVVFHLSVFEKVKRVSARKQWAAFVGPNYLVTIRPPEFRVPDELFQECETKAETREQYLSQGSGYLLYQIFDRTVDQYFKVLDKILGSMEDIEEGVFLEDVEVASPLSSLRRDIIDQRQVMFPTRALLVELEPKLKQYSKTDLTLYYSDLMDHVNKVCSTLDECTEVIDVFKDSDYLLSANRSNRAIRAIAILLAIGLPFVIVAGIYLILPGGLEKGTPRTSAALLSIVVALIATILYLLRRRHLI